MVSPLLDTEAWFHANEMVFVISAVGMSGAENEPEYHISATPVGNGLSLSDRKLAWVAQQFGMEDAEEDNPIIGCAARNLWLPVECREYVH